MSDCNHVLPPFTFAKVGWASTTEGCPLPRGLHMFKRGVVNMISQIRMQLAISRHGKELHYTGL